MPRPGEPYSFGPRGRDLPHGRFGYEMVLEILGAIVFYEAREVVKLRESEMVPPAGPPLREIVSQGAVPEGDVCD